MKKDNSTVRNTVVELESYHCNEYENRPKPSPYEAKKLDLEMAVLIQVGVFLFSLSFHLNASSNI